MTQRWMLISNCQTFGFMHSMMLANPELTVEGVDMWSYRADATRYNAEMAEYDRVVVHPDAANMAEYDPSAARAVSHLPSIEFGAYHPDCAYFWVDGHFVDGPMMTYQSLLANAAYELGLSVEQARALFTGEVFAACDYLNAWTRDRDALIERFDAYGIALAAPFLRWSRGRAFMYSINHPRIEAVWDVTRLFLANLGIETIETGLRPLDNLVPGPCLPVFPEIAEPLGVRGSSLYKPQGVFRYMTLEDMLEKSYTALSAFPRGAVRPHPTYEARYARVLSVIEGHA